MWPKILGVVVFILALPLAAVAIAIAMNRPMWFDPPGFSKRLSTYLYYHAAETAENPILPELRIRRYRVPEEEMRSAVERAVRSLPRFRMVRAERDLGVYQVEATSLLWRYRDDVSILVSRSASDGVEVYLHSVSRVGRGDLGANRVHILLFYEALERELKQGA